MVIVQQVEVTPSPTIPTSPPPPAQPTRTLAQRLSSATTWMGNECHVHTWLLMLCVALLYELPPLFAYGIRSLAEHSPYVVPVLAPIVAAIAGGVQVACLVLAHTCPRRRLVGTIAAAVCVCWGEGIVNEGASFCTNRRAIILAGNPRTERELDHRSKRVTLIRCCSRSFSPSSRSSASSCRQQPTRASHSSRSSSSAAVLRTSTVVRCWCAAPCACDGRRRAWSRRRRLRRAKRRTRRRMGMAVSLMSDSIDC